MSEFSADKMRATIDILNENLDIEKDIRDRYQNIKMSLESYYKFIANKGKLLQSAIERVKAIKDRNPDQENRINQLELRFISRLQQANTQDDLNHAYKALLDTLDKEKIVE
jgi:hypothetical protein